MENQYGRGAEKEELFPTCRRFVSPANDHEEDLWVLFLNLIDTPEIY